MTPISITILGNPVSWARMRTRNGHFFEDPKQRAARKVIATALLSAGAKPDAEQAWFVEVAFGCETKRQRDLDRLVSLLLDGATGVVFKDDSQIRSIHASMTIGLPVGRGVTTATFTGIGKLATS